MKKNLLATLLVAILASSMVFASFSGNATVKGFYDFDTKDYGFANGTSVNFELALGNEPIDKKSEGDIYASIKATLSLTIVDKDADGVPTGDPLSKANFDGVIVKPIAVIDEAKIGGDNWYVSILGTVNRLDLAKSAIDTWKVKDDKDDYGRLKADYTENASYAMPNKKAPGVEVNYAGYSLAVGGQHIESKGTDLTAHFKTPEIALVDGLTLQAGVAANQDHTNGEPTKRTDLTVGVSAKVAYAKDALTVSVATDMGFDTKAEKDAFGVDVAAKVGYDFVTVDAFYANKVKINADPFTNYLSARATFDLASFDLPLTVKVTAKNLISDAKQNISASVAYKADAYGAEVGGGYDLAKKEWNAYGKGNATVSFANIYAGAKVSQAEGADLALKPFVGAKTTTLIPGAELKVEWMGDDFDKDVLAKNYGAITAQCKIAF